MEKDVFKDLKEVLIKMLKEREDEIVDANKYLQRDDIPLWKRTTMIERNGFLNAQKEVIKEIQEKINA